MTSTDQIHLIQLTAGLALLSFGYSFMYVRTRLDSFREDLFAMRDELFDYMWKNDIPYSDPAYQALRNALNGHIRFARKTRLLSLWIVSFALRDEVKRFVGRDHTPVIGTIEQISDPRYRAYLRQVHQRLGSRVLAYMFLEGPFFPLAVLLKEYMRRRGVLEAQRTMGFDVMADEAAILGKPDSEQARYLLQACA